MSYFSKKAWQYVMLITALLLNQLPEPIPSSPLGWIVRGSQFGLGTLTALFFLMVAIVLQRRGDEEGGDDEHDAMIKKALTMAPAGGEISATWYASVRQGVNKLYSRLALGGACAIAMLLYHSYPYSMWEHLGIWFEDSWKYLLKTYSQKQLCVHGLMISHLVAHWGFGGLYVILDLWRPAWLLPYKIQPDYVLTAYDLGRAVAVALMNQGILYASCLLLWDVFPMVAPDGFDEKLPGLIAIGVSILAFLPFTDLFFFWPHYMFHKIQWCYDHIHYIHHSFMAPISITCIYAHPIEFIFGNVTIVLFGPYVFGSHMVTWWAWTFFSTVGTSIAHSGWRLPLPYVAAGMGHDYHHSNVFGPEGPQNIGNSGVCDAFMGTNTYYFTKTWNAKVDHYDSLDYPLVKILAEAGQLPGQNPSEAVEEGKTAAPIPVSEAGK